MPRWVRVLSTESVVQRVTPPPYRSGFHLFAGFARAFRPLLEEGSHLSELLQGVAFLLEETARKDLQHM